MLNKLAYVGMYIIDLKKVLMYGSRYYDNSKKLVVGKMKDETGGVAIETFVG